jgi:hypothetical protein
VIAGVKYCEAGRTSPGADYQSWSLSRKGPGQWDQE